MFDRSRASKFHRLAAGAGLALAAAMFASQAWGQAAAPKPAPATPAAAPAQSGPPPQQETVGDWRIVCVTQGTAKRCTLIQEQTATQNNQRLLAIEMGMNGDKLEGLLILPFGVLLDRGVSLQLDEQATQTSLRYRTCLPVGCVVSVSFDAKSLPALRGGTGLKVKLAVESGQEQTLTISLKGFGQALDRMAVLAKG